MGNRKLCLGVALLNSDARIKPAFRHTGKLLLTFLTMVTRWSRSTSNFYALIGQNLTGEFMREKFMEHLETCSDS